MTSQLEKAFAKAALLPEPVQDELASQLIEDIEQELQWDKTLAGPKSQQLLEQMAAEAREAKRLGKTRRGGFDLS